MALANNLGAWEMEAVVSFCQRLHFRLTPGQGEYRIVPVARCGL
ncbi:hypothetical protein Plim_1072 [Planctopirus limnophila DSM 3776]|uniref:Uncharacterized protein n=1 Tax=Planctopirus limnophila (strain ATCC 43296 / DSM 3776 / IFAM 1008 / Mu 290) TaxID=521674 RepID=D5STS4_PLAL2|nr:hypothetical protein Plim_1072 [Planctopirus limnophila DSM 3776]